MKAALSGFFKSPQDSVGAGLPAKRPAQSTSSLTVQTPSRASPLPQVFRCFQDLSGSLSSAHKPPPWRLLRVSEPPRAIASC
ncbi:hypothetical protein C1893_28675 [Pseudomonas sp. MPR-ANC1]|nr:hypothetical protein C1893_28675 [Pseudomonas sp. MPR-ANC1]